MYHKKKFFGLLTSAALLLNSTPITTFAEEMIEVPEAMEEKIEDFSYTNEAVGANRVCFTQKANTAYSAVATKEEEQLENGSVNIYVSAYPYTFPTSSKAFKVTDEDGNSVKFTDVTYRYYDNEEDKWVTAPSTINDNVYGYQAVVNGAAIRVTVLKVDAYTLNQVAFTDKANTSNGTITHDEKNDSHIETYPYTVPSYLAEVTFPYTLPTNPEAFKVVNPANEEISIERVNWFRIAGGDNTEIKDGLLSTAPETEDYGGISYAPYRAYEAYLYNAEEELVAIVTLTVHEDKTISNDKNDENLIARGEIGTAQWILDKDGTLTIGKGEYESNTSLVNYPWLKFDKQIKKVIGTAPFKAKGWYQGAFSQLENVESIDLSGWDTSELIDMGYLFGDCPKLKEINLSGWDTSNVIQIDRVFSNCSQLKEVDVSTWNTSNVSHMGGTFEGCSSLKKIDVSNWNTSKVEYMDFLFDGCTQLTTLDISSWDTSKAERYSYLFTLCENLSEIKYGFKSEKIALAFLSSFPDDWKWYQNDKGPYVASEVPSLSKGEVATLTKASEIDEPSSDDNKPNLPAEDYTPTPTGEAFSVSINLSVNDIAGISKEEGELDPDELVTLQTHLNKEPEYNPNGYDVKVKKASVSKNNGNYNFDLTLNVSLKPESKINLVFNKLKKRLGYQSAFIEEVAPFSLETSEKTYSVREEEDLVIIEGITTEEAFGDNNQIDADLIKNILSNEGYEVDSLKFTSNQNKNSSFILKDLTAPISIEVTSDEITIPVSKPNSNSSSSSTKPYRYPINKPNSSSPTVDKKVTYRLFNALTGEHFYTTSKDERNQLIQDTRWKDEGQGWIAPESSDFPIYRLCNPNTGEHHYTMDKNEYDTLATYGWKQEGVGFYSADSKDAKAVKLYRLFNPKATDAGSHHYTASEEEREALVAQGWKDEGIAWHGLTTE